MVNTRRRGPILPFLRHPHDVGSQFLCAVEAHDTPRLNVINSLLDELAKGGFLLLSKQRKAGRDDCVGTFVKPGIHLFLDKFSILLAQLNVPHDVLRSVRRIEITGTIAEQICLRQTSVFPLEVDPLVAQTKPRQHLVADGTGGAGDVVERHRGAKKFDVIAAAHRIFR